VKTCSRCGGLGPFGRNKATKDGFKSNCKKCCAQNQRLYAARNPHVWKNWAEANAERLRARDTARYAADPDGEKARVLAYQRAHPDKVRSWQHKHLYGITPEDSQAFLDKQGGKCAICSGSLVPGRKGMQVDHDHETGKVRGFLCAPCNTMLGDFREKSPNFQAAVAYLQQGFVTGLTPMQRPQEVGYKSRGTRAGNLWYLYGLTEQTFQELLDRQGGCCAICLEVLKPGHGTHLDHDHALGRKRGLRGLLCRSCNIGLGHAREGLHVLLGAVRYLENRA
jgi:hypothetical protein